MSPPPPGTFPKIHPFWKGKASLRGRPLCLPPAKENTCFCYPVTLGGQNWPIDACFKAPGWPGTTTQAPKPPVILKYSCSAFESVAESALALIRSSFAKNRILIQLRIWTIWTLMGTNMGENSKTPLMSQQSTSTIWNSCISWVKPTCIFVSPKFENIPIKSTSTKSF